MKCLSQMIVVSQDSNPSTQIAVLLKNGHFPAAFLYFRLLKKVDS